jgi:hypothetical protein
VRLVPGTRGELLEVLEVAAMSSSERLSRYSAQDDNLDVGFTATLSLFSEPGVQRLVTVTEALKTKHFTLGTVKDHQIVIHDGPPSCPIACNSLSRAA